MPRQPVSRRQAHFMVLRFGSARYRDLAKTMPDGLLYAHTGASVVEALKRHPGALVRCATLDDEHRWYSVSIDPNCIKAG